MVDVNSDSNNVESKDEAVPQGESPVAPSKQEAVPQGEMLNTPSSTVSAAAPSATASAKANVGAPQSEMISETTKSPSAKAGAPQGEMPTSQKKRTIKSAGLGAGKVSGKMAVPQKKAANKTEKQLSREPLNAVVIRNSFYRDGFRNLLRIAIVEAVIILALIVCFVVYMNAHQPQDRYFATTADGRIMKLSPLDRPNMNKSALMSWVAQAATEVMTFGFHDYQRRLQESSRHFTRRGWESFTGALQRSRIIEAIENDQQVVTAAPRSAPVLKQAGIFNGHYRWIVELPLDVQYKAKNKSRSDSMIVTITIDRVPTLENIIGVGIEQWIAR